jgi:hypothetical protein
MTPKRLAANRANAQLSTGPRTPAGKRRSSQNSLKHGLCSNLYLYVSETDEPYRNHCRMIREALMAVSDIGEELAQSIADDFWRVKAARGPKKAVLAKALKERLVATKAEPVRWTVR